MDYGRCSALVNAGRRLIGHQSTPISFVAIDYVQGYFSSWATGRMYTHMTDKSWASAFRL